LHGLGNKVYPITSWTVSSGSFTIPASVPGDLVSDLEAHGGFGDPLFHLNWKNASYDTADWSYSASFDAPAADSSTDMLLVFDSVKMGASVVLNGEVLGDVQDQFLRYNFSVGRLLQPKDNVLKVNFYESTHVSNLEGRFQACSGGWDWAPYTSTATAQGDPTFTRGIVRDVYLVPVKHAAIAHVVPLITHTGAYPASPLKNMAAAQFNVDVDVVLWAPKRVPAGGRVSISQTWNPGAASTVLTLEELPAGETVVRVTLPAAERVQLWWPKGLGAQKLYSIGVDYQEAGSDEVSTATRSVGFRTAHVVTTNDTACANTPSCAAGHGSGEFTMRLKMNGADVWSRGANVIPMDEMEARESAAAYRAMLSHAAAAGMNVVRVWGGGKFLPHLFYDTADEMGLMVMHDLMYGTPWFGGNGSIPVDSPLQHAEVTHNVRRLASHPSIVVWMGGNEFRSGGEHGFPFDDVVQNFIGPVVAAVTGPTVAVWPYSPSEGWISGVNTLTGLPDGSPFKFSSTSLKTTGTIETHGPYQHGAGFETVDGAAALNLFPANVPPSLVSTDAASFGPQQPGTLASEFGASVWSSFESMAPTLDPKTDWSAHNPAMHERNYPADNFVQVYFGEEARAGLDELGALSLQRACYFQMLGQMLQQKGDIEARRTANSQGMVTWQLNEIWPTGGWGSLEYGTVNYTKGQVLGGRWKPVHYLLASHLYRDTVIICGDSGQCLLKNDNALSGFNGHWVTTLQKLGESTEIPLGSGAIDLPRGSGAARWVCANGGEAPCAGWSHMLAAHGCASDGSDCLLRAVLRDADNNIADEHVDLLAPPVQLAVPHATIDVTVASAPAADGSVTVSLSADTTALLVMLTTGEQGVWSDNALTLAPGERRQILLRPIAGARPIDAKALAADLRVEHLAQYMSSNARDSVMLV
jgi:beta-galactosidase/beta-glucuronidase